jgi:N-acetylglucosaminyl-diphospho-decaprenol L-rhamnosyltransferase
VHVAVTIVSYRSHDDLRACLNALDRSTYGKFEVIICENGGPDAYLELARSVPSIRSGGQPVSFILAPSNVGYGAGINLCLDKARNADAWWILNPDTEVESRALEDLVTAMKDEQLDAVSCSLVLPDGSIEYRGAYWRSWLAWPKSCTSWMTTGPRRGSHFYLHGASMLVSRQFLEKVGQMREDYFLYCEDVDWSLRAKNSGMRMGLSRGAGVLHHKGTSTGAVQDFSHRSQIAMYFAERNKMLLSRDHFPHRLPLAALAAPLVLIGRFGRRRAWPQIRFGLAGWWAGLRNIRGNVFRTVAE